MSKEAEQKRRERVHRRKLGFVARQVWVHEDDREAFDDFVVNLPKNKDYKNGKFGIPCDGEE